MKNKIGDLNNHLFAQLERLSDEQLTPEKLEMEVNRSKAIVDIANQIVDTSRVQLDAMKLMEKAGYDIKTAGENILKIEK